MWGNKYRRNHQCGTIIMNGKDKAHNWEKRILATYNNTGENQFTVKNITMVGKAYIDGSEIMQEFKIDGVKWVTPAFLAQEHEYLPSLTDRKQAGFDEFNMSCEYYLDGSLLEMATEVFDKLSKKSNNQKNIKDKDTIDTGR